MSNYKELNAKAARELDGIRKLYKQQKDIINQRYFCKSFIRQLREVR